MTLRLQAISAALFTLMGVVQAVVGTVTVLRLMCRLPGRPIAPNAGGAPAGAVTVLVPVLNEADRIAPCLAGLARQGPEVGEVLVIDGGSTDETRSVVQAAQSADARIRWIQAGPQPDGWNGKLWNLVTGAAAAAPSHQWLLTIDADVRPRSGLVAALVAHADREHLHVLSVATDQRLSGLAEGLVHPSLLTTLVYRCGAPGRVATALGDVQANGQCMLLRADVPAAIGGLQVAHDSVCEDLTLARAVAAAGLRTGFYQAPGLIDVEMYQGAADAWANWPRSLSLRDRFSRGSSLAGLAQVTLVQAFPLVLLALTHWLAAPRWVIALNRGLLALRLGLLVGIAPAYPGRPASYWLSPLLDMPVAAALWRSALTHRHTWRGRTITTGGFR